MKNKVKYNGMKPGKLEEVGTKKVNLELEISYIAKSSDCCQFYADCQYAWSLQKHNWY